MRLALLLFAIALLAASVCLPQKQTTAPAWSLRYEVASIVPSDPASQAGSSWQTGPSGDIRVHAVPMLSIIEAAFGVHDFQVTGYPAWVDSDDFDVETKGEESTGSGAPQDAPHKLQAKLQVLLAERCKLVVEHTTRDMETLVLTVDPAGLKITEAEPNPQWRRSPFEIHAAGITMEQFTRTLANIVRAPVTNDTGLKAAYRIDLKYAESPEMWSAKNESNGPDIFNAMKSQLGLLLTRRKAPVEVVVVKSIERPSAN